MTEKLDLRRPPPPDLGTAAGDEAEERAVQEAVARGREDIAAGRSVSNTKVMRWLKSWGREKELGRPKCK
jgi:predicted transcriptional regulator